jgi:hypothetical protein
MPTREMPWSGQEELCWIRTPEAPRRGWTSPAILRKQDTGLRLRSVSISTVADHSESAILNGATRDTAEVSSDQQQDPAQAKHPEQQDLGGPDDLQYIIMRLRRNTSA